MNTRIRGGGRLRNGLPATTSSARAPARQHRSPSCKLCTSDLGRARNTTLPNPIPTTNRLTSELTCDHIYPPARSVGGAGEGAHPRPSCEPKATWDVGAGTPLLEFCVPWPEFDFCQKSFEPCLYDTILKNNRCRLRIINRLGRPE